MTPAANKTYLRNLARNKFILNISSADNALCFNRTQKFRRGKQTLTICMVLTNDQSTILSFGQKTTERRFVKIVVVCHCIKCRITKGRICLCENTLLIVGVGSQKNAVGTFLISAKMFIISGSIYLIPKGAPPPLATAECKADSLFCMYDLSTFCDKFKKFLRFSLFFLSFLLILGTKK